MTILATQKKMSFRGGYQCVCRVIFPEILCVFPAIPMSKKAKANLKTRCPGRRDPDPCSGCYISGTPTDLLEKHRYNRNPGMSRQESGGPTTTVG